MNEQETTETVPIDEVAASDTPTCLNCGEPAGGSFCPSCGQATRDLDLPFHRLLGEWFGAFVAFDSRLLGTLRLLMTRPGALTQEFLAGRRKRWVHPLKLYLAVSLLLFLTLGLSGFTIVTINDDDGATNSPVKFNVDVDTPESEPPPTAEKDSAEPSWLTGIFLLYLDDPERFNDVFVNRLAKAIFLLVPVFALLLKGLYRRTLYVHHLVFSLHQHSFAFLAILVGLLIDMGFGAIQGPGNAVAVLAIAVYTLLALRRCYPQTWLRTISKMVVLLIGYLVPLFATMAVALFATSLTM